MAADTGLLRPWRLLPNRVQRFDHGGPLTVWARATATDR